MNSTEIQLDFDNSTLSGLYGFEPKNLHMVESSVLVGIFFYALAVALHKILSVGIRFRNGKLDALTPPTLSCLSKLFAFFERLLIFFSIIFCIFYAFKYYIFCASAFCLSNFILFLFGSLKILTETFSIIMSIIALSIFANTENPDLNWEQTLRAVIRVVSGFVLMKEFSMAIWILMIAVFRWEYTSQIFGYYFGIFLSTQFLHVLSVVIRLFPGNKPWKDLTNMEKQAIRNVNYSFMLKLPVVVNMIIIAVEGGSGGLVFSCWIVLEVFILPISVRYIAIWELLKSDFKDKNNEEPVNVEVEMGRI